MELMIVVIILGIIAGYGTVSYQQAQLKARERDIRVQLNALHGAIQMYYARNNQYWDTDAMTPKIRGVDDIYATFGINLTEQDGLEYIYRGYAGGASYIAWGKDHTNNFHVRITEVSMNSGLIPCCERDSGNGPCPTLPDCTF